MGAIIEAVEALDARRWPRREGSVAVAARAARAALRSARCDPGDVGVLVNAGVYRDDMISEPAMAPFVQRRIGANPRCAEDGPATFSFDVANGGCGLLNAVQVVDGLLHSGRSGRGLVVASDVDPTPRASRGLRFAPAGAALLLRPGAPDEGFSRFRFASYPKHAHLLRAQVRWIGDERPRRARARHAPVHEEAPQYLPQAVKSAARATREFLEDEGVSLSELGLLIPSLLPATFPRALGAELGIDPERLVDATGARGPVFTAGHAFGVKAARESGRWAAARTALFVAVGAGIDVALALYRSPA